MKKLYPIYPDNGLNCPESINLIELSVCESTNSYIKENIESLIDLSPLIVSADTQIAGRGRNGREWISAGPGGAYTSILINIKNNNCLGLLSIAAGIAVLKAVKKVTGLHGELKWPNDIEISGKKTGGILIENQIFNNKVVSVAGIGLNINNEKKDFPSEISKIATSLYLESGEKKSIMEIIENITGYFLSFIESMERGETKGLIKLYSKYLKHKQGDPVTFHDGKSIIKGNFIGLKDNGGLILELSDGKKKTFYSGEILTLSRNISG